MIEPEGANRVARVEAGDVDVTGVTALCLARPWPSRCRRPWLRDARDVTLPDGRPALALMAGTHRLTETWIER